MSAPFTGASELEVLARVSLAYVKYLRRRYPSSFRDWDSVYAWCEVHLPRGGPIGLWAVMTGAHVAMCKGMRFQHYIDTVIGAARCGYTWRRCLYPDYKRNRDDPRVTNRGVRGRR